MRASWMEYRIEKRREGAKRKGGKRERGRVEKEESKDGGGKEGRKRQGKNAGKVGLYGTPVWLYTVGAHYKARETPWLSTGSLILLVPVRECFLATLVNLAKVAHLENTGFPTQGSRTPKTHHLFTYLVLREIQGP